jgi:hypothetical protein
VQSSHRDRGFDGKKGLGGEFMSMAILGWQIFIFFTIAISGRKAGWVSLFWIVWTLAQVFALPLSILQIFTIWLAYSVTKPAPQ